MQYWKKNEISENGHLIHTDPQEGGIKYGQVIPILESINDDLKGKIPVKTSK